MSGGKQGYLELADFPHAAAVATVLVDAAAFLEAEARHLLAAGLFTGWHEPINLGGWRVFGVRWQGDDMPPAVGTFAQRLLAGHGAVLNAGYSLMEPGAEISPHVGYTGDVIRLHVPLVVPDGDCALVVAGEARRWAPGEPLLFDDTVLHSAHNRATGPRLIFLLDILRDA